MYFIFIVFTLRERTYAFWNIGRCTQQVFPQAAQAQYESKIFGVVSYGIIPKMAVNIKDL